VCEGLFPFCPLSIPPLSCEPIDRVFDIRSVHSVDILHHSYIILLAVFE